MPERAVLTVPDPKPVDVEETPPNSAKPGLGATEPGVADVEKLSVGIVPRVSDEDLGTADPDHLFRTDHIRAELKSRTIRGGIITVCSQGVKFLLNLGSTMALARLLSPSEIGVVAMVTPITSFIAMFKDLGLSLATVQREEITHKQVSTLFWINVAVSIVLMLVTAAISPFIGWFYHDSRTTWIMLATAGGFLFGGLAAQHSALLIRNMRFGTSAIIEITSMTVSVGTGILTASMGWSYWSLVAMSISGGFVTCVAMWIASPWRPGPPVRNVGARSMLIFGAGMTGTNILAFLSTQIDKVMLGIFYKPSGTADFSQEQLVHSRNEMLGVYSRAHLLFVMPILQIMTPFYGVITPLFSRLAVDRKRLSEVAINMMEISTALVLPVSLVVFFCTPEIVRVVLGGDVRWEAAIPITKTFCLMAFSLPATLIAGTLFVAMGRSDVLFKWELFWLSSLAISILLGLPWGGHGVAIGMTTAGLSTMPIYFYLVHRVSGMDLRRVGIILLRNIASIAVCTCGVLLVGVAASGFGITTVFLLKMAVIGVLHGSILMLFGVHRRALAILRSRNSQEAASP